MSSFPGLNDPYLALTLLAIEPALQGVLIAGPSGTGKSKIARLSKVLFPKNAPFVNLPLGCTVSQLVGGIDLEQSRAQKTLVTTPGLLARANGGVLYIDEINLLPTEITTVLMQALMQGEVQLEREGASITYSAKFSIIGTFNPAERELPAAMYDRMAFLVFSETINHLGWRMFVTARQQNQMHIPEDVISRVARARSILPHVTITDKQLSTLCQYANDMGIEGNRAEVLAVRCAKANAALNFRAPVTHEDIYLAIKLVYMPRLGDHALADSDIARKTNSPEANKDKGGEAQEQPGKQPEQQNKGIGGDHTQEKPFEKQPQETGKGDSRQGKPKQPLPEKDDEEGFLMADFPQFKGTAPGRPPAGKHQLAYNLQRGRHTGSVQGLPSKGKIDLLATLKSAAINQPVPGTKEQKLTIKASDIHIKKYQQRSGLLFIFAVDGSGSMAINHFEAAKGAALRLLEKAYVYRDQVALIYFRNKEAQVLLPPGTGVTKAAAALKKIRAGGKTPLGAALIKTLDMVKKNNAQRTSPGTVLVLFTDGKANQPIRPNEAGQPEVVAMDELKAICPTLQSHITSCLVFDTRMGRRDNPYGIELAQMLGANYVRLPKLNADDVLNEMTKQTNVLR